MPTKIIQVKFAYDEGSLRVEYKHKEESPGWIHYIHAERSDAVDIDWDVVMQECGRLGHSLAKIVEDYHKSNPIT